MYNIKWFNVKQVNRHGQNDKDTLFINDISHDIGRKLYLPINLNLGHANVHRAVTLLDSGADLPICQKDYFLRLFSECSESYLLSKLVPSKARLQSYTKTPIPIMGTIKMKISHLKGQLKVDINMYIVDSPGQSSTPMIMPLKMLGALGLNMNWIEISGEQVPQLINMKENNTTALSYYYSDAELSYCYGYTNYLRPKEVKPIQFIISPATAVTLDDKVLLTEDYIPYYSQPSLKIQPSTSVVYEKDGELIAMALVKNISNDSFKGAIRASVELCDNHTETREVKEHTIRQLIKDRSHILQECHLPFENEISIKEVVLDNLPNLGPGTSGGVPSKLYNIHVRFPESPHFPANGEAIDNDVDTLDKSLTEERFPVKETAHNKSQAEIDTYYDPKETIQLGFYDNLPSVTHDDMVPDGLTIPALVQKPSDIVKEEDYDPDIWPYVKDIFIDTYPSVIARHSLDTGRISDTLGYYTIRLKPNVTLPKYKKIYHNPPMEAQMMRDILEALLKQEVIIKASCAGGDIPDFASPAFLVKRANEASSARLVVDFKLINECIAREAISIPNFAEILNELRDCILFSSLDLKNAFNSIGISKESQPLTQFVCQFGSFYFTRLPTGMNVSPNILDRYCDKMLQYTPLKDKNGKIETNDENLPIMVPDTLKGCRTYYDDLIMSSKGQSTWQQTLDEHFKLLKEVVKRVAFHNGKFDMSKAVIAKSKINWLGWIISNNFCIADPKRVQKVKLLNFPVNPKGMRKFIGTVNSLRIGLGFNVLQHVGKLSPLTSTRLKVFTATQEQRDAFEALKQQLTAAPLYSRIVLPGAPKILCTDAASEKSACFSAVLLQVVPAKNPKEIIPSFLYFDDKTHRIIFDAKLPCRPIRLMHENETPKEYLSNLEMSDPPEFDYLTDKNFGYDDMENSLGVCLKSMIVAHRCSQDYNQLCIDVADKINKSIVKHQLLNGQFRNDKQQLNNYIENIRNGRLLIDDKLYIFQILANVLHRTMKVVNSTTVHDGNQILSFEAGKKPPFFFLLYQVKGRLVVRPTLLDAYSEYSLARHRGSLEIILYYSKTISEDMRKLKILDLELFSLLNSLAACKKLVGGDELLALVDSKPLYFLYHQDVTESITKLVNWGKKITGSFPQIKLAFISTLKNPSDFLTRRFDVPKPQLTRLQLPRYVNNLLDDYIPKDRTFTINEWINWVRENDQFLEYCVDKKERQKLPTHQIATIDVALKYSKRNVTHIYNPIKALEKILTLETIIQKQQTELKDLYDECAIAPNHQLTKDDVSYTLNHGILYIQKQSTHAKLMIPESLIAAYISMSHLTSNHAGYERMIAILENYYHKDLGQLCKKFSRSCFACQLCNYQSRQNKLRPFPLTSDACEVLYMDLMENIGPSGQQSKFQNVLLVKDPISNFMILIPMRTKTAEEFIHVFVTNVYQIFHPRQIYSDNGKLFSSKDTISTLALLNVEMIYSSAYSPQSHGSIEVMVRVFKQAMRKYLTIESNLNWSLMAPIVSHLHNSSKIVKSKFSPYEIIFGQNTHLSTGYLDHLNLPKLHPIIQSHQLDLEKKNIQLKKILQECQDRIVKERDNRTERRNRTRVLRKFAVGDFVFMKDRSITPGSTKPLRSKFYNTPFVIIYDRPATVLLQRLSDGIVLNRHKDDIKKYVKFSEEFEHLPPEVLKICQQEVYEITEQQLEDLLKVEDFKVEQFEDNIKEDEKLINEDFLPPLPFIPEEENELDIDDDEDDNRVTTRSMAKRVTFGDTSNAT